MTQRLETGPAGLALLFVFVFLQFGFVTSIGTAGTFKLHQPEAVDLDKDEISDLRERVRKLEPLTTMLMSNGDQLVAEYYQDGYTPDRTVNIKSASKSVISALVGIALAEGSLDGLDQPLIEFFPEILADEPLEKRNITLRDVLLMRSGLKSTSFENYGRWVTSDNWLAYALNQPIVHPPGQVTDYSTGNSHIIAAVLSEATGRDLWNYAQERLFDPLNVDIKSWQESPEGYRFGGNNLGLTSNGLLQFGQLYLNDGRWNDEQVIPSRWIEQSTASIVHDTKNGYPYGYFWWNSTYDGIDVDFAWGHGGQYVFVVPELDLVVVLTSYLQSKSGSTDDYTEKVHRLLENKIIEPLRKKDDESEWYFF